MIIGAHTVLYSTDADADRAFLREVLKLRTIDAGGGYLIFGLPDSEASMHKSDRGEFHQEFYLLCDDVDAFIAEMGRHDAACEPVQDTGWGRLTRVTCRAAARSASTNPGTNARRTLAAECSVFPIARTHQAAMRSMRSIVLPSARCACSRS